MTLLYILLGVIATALVTISFFCYQYNNKVAATLNRIEGGTGGLTNTLALHQQAVEKMPASFNNIVSKELNSGLSETVESIQLLQTELGNTHLSFQALFQNIPNLDEMPRWFVEIKETIQPLKSAALGLETLDDKIINHFNTFVAGRDKLETAFLQIENLIEEWTQESKTERAEFRQLIAKHLDNLYKQTAKVEESMTEIQKFSRNNDDLIKGISQNLPSTVGSLQNLSQEVGILIQSAENSTTKASRLLENWENRAQVQQWQLWASYGLMSINIILLLIIVIKLIPS